MSNFTTTIVALSFLIIFVCVVMLSPQEHAEVLFFAVVTTAIISSMIAFRMGREGQAETVKQQGQKIEGLEDMHERDVLEFQQKTTELKATHEKTVLELLSRKADELRGVELEYWLQSLANPPWTRDAREIEIEVKFVSPLLRHLGYRTEDMALRVSVPIQEGSKKTTREADWVVRNEKGDALLVVEAKAPAKPLGENVAKQARSYAFRLGAPVYITTNGNQLEIFQRGVLEDRCAISCDTNQLAEKWETIQGVAGKENVQTLRESLTTP